MSSVERFWREMAATQSWSGQAVALLSAIADPKRTPRVPAHVRGMARRLVDKFPAPTVYPQPDG